MKTLIIDTSHQLLVVGVAQDSKVLASFQEIVAKRQSEMILVTIDRLLQEQGINPTALDEIVVTDGPGSYTGMRIGIAFTKTYALVNTRVRVYTVDTLASLVGSDTGFAFIDARSNRYFGAFVDHGVVQEEGIYSGEAIEALDVSLFGDVHLITGQSQSYKDIVNNILAIRDTWKLVENVDTLVPRYVK